MQEKWNLDLLKTPTNSDNEGYATAWVWMSTSPILQEGRNSIKT